MYHCVEFWAVGIVVLKILHGFLDLGDADQILVQTARRPETEQHIKMYLNSNDRILF